MRAKALKDLIESKAVRRNLSLKIFDWGDIAPAGGNKVRQEIVLRRGLPDDLRASSSSRSATSSPRSSRGSRVTPIRVAGKSKDELQRVITWLRGAGRGGAAPVRELPLGSRRCPDPVAPPDRHARGRGRGHRRHAREHDRDGRPRGPLGSPAPLAPQPTEFTPHTPARGRTAVPAGRQEVAMHPHDDEPVERLDGSHAGGRPVRGRSPPPTPRRGDRARRARRWPPRARRTPVPTPASRPRRGRGAARRGRLPAPSRSPPRRRPSPSSSPPTLRAAGVRFAFTVPGESFLAVLDALAAAGIRVVATRHEGGAAFMAEAYGQLTGRPRPPRDPHRRRREPRRSASTPRPPTRRRCSPSSARSSAGSAAARRSRRSTWSRTIGALAMAAASSTTSATAAGTLEAAVRAAVDGRPGPALLSCPRTCSTRPARRGRRRTPSRPAPGRPGARRRPRGPPLPRRRPSAR